MTFVLPHLTGAERIRLLIRRILAATLFYSGICSLYRFLRMRKQAVILTYHRVIDSVELGGFYIQPAVFVTEHVFRQQMQYLSRHYHVISLDELIDTLLEGKPFQRNTCVITFDDGWKDFYTHAFPILQKYNLPAAVFLVSDYVGTNRWFWPERVSYLLMQYLEVQPTLKYQLNRFPTLERIGFFGLATDSDLTPGQKIEMTIATMKALSRTEIAKAIGELQNLSPMPSKQEPKRPLLLNWAEVGRMVKWRITFGSHTSSHQILTTASNEEAQEEIIRSKGEIEKYLSMSCWAFCYPNGNYDGSIKKIVQEHYKCALAADSGFVRHGDDLFALKRIGIHNDISFTKSMFACKISGILR